MLRGFIEIYQIDHNKTYLTDFRKVLITHGIMPEMNGACSRQIGAAQIKTRKMALDTSCFHRNVWKVSRNRFAIITFNNPLKNNRNMKKRNIGICIITTTLLMGGHAKATELILAKDHTNVVNQAAEIAAYKSNRPPVNKRLLHQKP